MIGVVLILGLMIYVGVLTNSLTILSISGIVLALSFKFKDLFKKSWIFYTIGVLISISAVVFEDTGYFDLVTRGFVGYGFMVLVMFGGIFPNKWHISRIIKKNRGVYSILSFIMISPHALGHIFGLLGEVNLFGIAAYVVMVPLTIISFRVIRKEIEPADWFKIQKAAYAVYLILFVHLIVVAAWEDKIVYAVLVVLYLNNKIIKEVSK